MDQLNAFDPMAAEFEKQGITLLAVSTDTTADKIGARIRHAETDKVHTILLIGQREQEAGNLAVREHGKGDLGAKPKSDVIKDLLNRIKTREG